MGKLLSKNKKILFLLGLVLFLSLTIPEFARADGAGTCTCIQGSGPVTCNPGTNNCSPGYTQTCTPPPMGVGACSCECVAIVEETSKFCPGANWWNLGMWLQCILEFLGSFLFKIPLFFVAGLGLVLAILAGLLLLFVQGIAGQLIYYSITVSTQVPGNIDNIAGEVRTVAVQFLFLFLAIIGLATILKIHEYEFRKALVPLIVVALLINFSGAIVTAIVNIGNSFTNYFLGLDPATSPTTLQTGNLKIIDVNELLDNITTGINSLAAIVMANGHFFDDLNNHVLQLTGLASISFIIALFYIFAALVILIFGLVFFIRIIFIWLLIIIAPIAFASAVFKTKEIKSIFVGPLNWDGWWTMLLEWSFMGFGLALWLVLAMKLKEVGAGTFPYTAPSDIPPAISGGDFYQQTIVDVFKNLFGYLAALVALWLGATTAPGMIGEMSKKAFGAAKGFVTTVAAAGAIGMGAGAIAGFKGGFGSKWRERLEGLKEGEKPSAGKTIKAGVLGVGAGLSLGLGTMTRRGFGVGVAGIAKPIPEEIKKEAAPFWLKREFITTKEEAEKYVDESRKKEGLEGVKNIAKSKSLPDVLKATAIEQVDKEEKLSDDVTENPEVQKLLNKTQYAELQKRALKLRPDLSFNFTNPKTGKTWTVDEVSKEIIDKLTPSEAIKIRPKALLDPSIISAMNPRHLNSIIRNGTPEQKDSLAEGYATLLAKETGHAFDISTPEKLRNDLIISQSAIQQVINNKIASPKAEDVKTAEVIKELGNALTERKIKKRAYFK